MNEGHGLVYNAIAFAILIVLAILLWTFVAQYTP